MKTGISHIRPRHLMYVFICTLLCTFASCNKRPEYVVSKGKMTDVLYDYHLVQGLALTLPADSMYLIQKYYDAIFENNGITEEEFDSSMVYYNRHSDEMLDIYAELQERFTDEEKTLQLTLDNNEMVVFSNGGDTTDIWMGEKVYVLRHNDMLNKATFHLKCDTSFHRHDKFQLNANTAYIRENNEDRNYFLTLCLTLQYKNGRTVSNLTHTSGDGPQQLRLEAVDDEDLASVSGFFYYEGRTGGRNLGVVNNITLVRMHNNAYEPVDTVSADTLNTDSPAAAPVVPHRTEPALTPEQKRQQSVTPTNTEKVEIRTMPEVRRPNSFGRARRINRRR